MHTLRQTALVAAYGLSVGLFFYFATEQMKEMGVLTASAGPIGYALVYGGLALLAAAVPAVSVALYALLLALVGFGWYWGISGLDGDPLDGPDFVRVVFLFLPMVLPFIWKLFGREYSAH